MMLSLGQPIWLLLLLPLAAALWLWPAPTRFLQVWRCGVVSMIILGMCWPLVRLPSRHGTVVVVVDRSLSMPQDAQQQQFEQVRLVAGGMTPQDRLGVVTFGRDIAVERPPDVGPLQPWVQEVAGDGSSLALAVSRALALLPAQGPSRLLVLSDGRWTGSDPAAIAAAAASRQAPIDFRYLSRPTANDLAVELFDAPRSASPGESFMVSAWVRSPSSQSVRYELLRNQQVIAKGTREMPAGTSRLIFRDKAASAGTHSYSLRVEADAPDPVPENNIARTLVGIHGASSLLMLTQSPGQGMAKMLNAGGIKVTARAPQEVQWSLEYLSGFNGVVFENVPANSMTAADMQTLASWIQQTGSGLLMTGGKQSFGPGGYFKSPLDPILPVSMELRQEHRKFSVAIVVTLDRSGSMTAPVGGGKTKMDLANLGTAQVVDLLSPMDELGVIAVDSSPHTIIPLSPVSDRESFKSKILRMRSEGGGIFIYEGLVGASGMIATATPQTRHIILFADAADSEEPGNYKSLLDQCQAAGITVSVIGLGTERDSDADLLKDIAARGKGRIYFTENAAELPRLFAQDTFVVARSSFVDEATPVAITGGMVSIAGRNFSEPGSVGGYNLCYVRQGANLAAVTRDEYNAPLVAAWQAGSGRVATYTGEVDGQYTGEAAKWPEFGEMLTSLTRWTTGRNLPLPAHMMIRQVLDKGQYRIELLLDPDRAEMDLASLPVVSVLSGKVGEAPRSERLSMRWISPDSLAVDVPLRSDDTALATIDMGGLGVHTLSPVCLPYSPEFEPSRSGQGRPSLEQLARVTAGKERIDLPGIWQELARQPRWEPVAHWVLIVAVLMLLLEVFERRSGMMSMALSHMLGARQWLRTTIPADTGAGQGTPMLKLLKKRGGKRSLPPPALTTAGGKGQENPSGPPTSASPSETPAGPQGSSGPTGSMADALNQARRRTEKRSSRKD